MLKQILISTGIILLAGFLGLKVAIGAPCGWGHDAAETATPIALTDQAGQH